MLPFLLQFNPCRRHGIIFIILSGGCKIQPPDKKLKLHVKNKSRCVPTKQGTFEFISSVSER